LPTFVAARACGFGIAPLDLAFALPSVPFKSVPFKLVPFKSVPQWLGPPRPELVELSLAELLNCL